MDSMDNVRERLEALEQQIRATGAHTRTVERQLPGWWGIVCGVLLMSLVSLAPLSQAANFACASGDVACLIDAINQANANGEANTITLEAGTYTLTAAAPNTFGFGLPSVTSTLTIRGTDTTIIERAPDEPLGFSLLRVEEAGVLTLQGLILRGGGNGGIGAGGLSNGGTLTILQSTIAQNVGFHEGGGIHNRGGELTIVQSAIVDNLVGDGAGGGILNEGGVVIVHNSTLTGNRATGSNIGSDGPGGAIANFPGQDLRRLPGTVSVTNSTLAENAGCAVGGIASLPGGIVTMLNTILAQNHHDPTLCLLFAPRVGNDCDGAVTSLGHNLIGDLTGCTITLQRSDLTGDPGLDTFTDDGTPGHGHFPLLPTSQAIDAGNTGVCPSTDQLGQRRIGRCDIGAIRFLDGIDLLQADDPTTAAKTSQ